MIHECSRDHRLETYAVRDRRLLALVESFNRRLVEAFGSGADLTKVVAALDPDPARYTWVDEGQGLVEAVLAEAEAELASAPVLPGFRSMESRMVPASAPAARPAVAVGPDGSILLAWVEWIEREGERVVVVRTDAAGSPTGEPQIVSGPLGDCLRPSVAFDGDGAGFVFFGLRRDDEVGVWCAREEGRGFGSAELFSTTAHPSFNQEVARLDDGSLECCWQGYVGGRFAIFSRRQRTKVGFSQAELISSPEERNVWDPTLAPDGAGGVAYAWTNYGADGYTTALSSRPRTGKETRRVISAPRAYSLHPSLTFDRGGSLWCAYDAVALGGHGGSGPTRLRTQEEMWSPRVTGTRPDGRAVPSDLSPDITAAVVVVRMEGDGANPEETGTVGEGLHVSPAGLPRLATTSEGSVAVAYRCLRRLPLMLYFWDTVVEWHDEAGWGSPTSFDRADGPLEEPSLAPGAAGGVVVSWQEDGRRDLGVTWTEGFGGEECLELRDHYGEVVWHSVHTGGRVRLAQVTAPDSARDRTPSSVRPRVVPAEPPADARSWARARRGASPERYTTSADGTEYGLYWGDLHRHSLVSRCTAGDEPDLDDFYRYSFDVCEYDFWAVTDHAENTSRYQWWAIQKLADVLHVPGRFVPFYGFEWTSASGHQNVVYDSSRRGAPIYSSTAAETSTPAQLWGRLRQAGQRSLTIPHHPGSAMVPFDWSYRDEEMLRLVEVFQACRGNYEAEGCFRQYSDGTLSGTFVADGLAAGHRFGLISSSDHGNGASYVGAFAKELSREAIFDALHGRRTIAATTRDVVVDFRLNDCFMGATAPSSSRAALAISARGYHDIARLDVVRQGELAHSITPELELAPGHVSVPLRVEWTTGETSRTDWSGYLVVEGGEVLETVFWSPEIVEVTKNGLAWSAETRNFRSQYGAQRGGIEVTLFGPPEAAVQVTTGPAAGATTLGQLAALGAGAPGPSSAGRIELGRTKEGALYLQRGTGGLRSLGTSELSASFEDKVTGPTWYYARVTLEDGEMAWSSPIWIAP